MCEVLPQNLKTVWKIWARNSLPVQAVGTQMLPFSRSIVYKAVDLVSLGQWMCQECLWGYRLTISKLFCHLCCHPHRELLFLAPLSVSANEVRWQQVSKKIIYIPPLPKICGHESDKKQEQKDNQPETLTVFWEKGLSSVLASSNLIRGRMLLLLSLDVFYSWGWGEGRLQLL